MESVRMCSGCCRKHVCQQICQAMGKVFFKSNKLKNYARLCRSKTVHQVEVPGNSKYEDGDSFIEIAYRKV